ncbi:MAG: glycosyltransferase family 1 protein [Parachlamydiaceae bacterium]|nr:glycosyltransferase family 1 protein [Parachlamydiaceae bacterium]
MKFCILCIGSHGDIRPYVALGVGLKAEAHEVWIASHKKACSLCEKYNLNFKLVDGDLTELINSENTQKELKGNILSKILKIMCAFKKILKIQLPMSLDAAAGADVLIYSPAAFAGPHIAEYLRIPSFLMHLQPEIRTKFHPSHLFPNQKSLKGINFLLGHFLSEQLFWQPIRRYVNKWRKEILGIKKMHFLGPKYDPLSKNTHTLVAFSHHLIPRPIDWGPHIHMTNFCLLNESENWSPPQELEKFLRSQETIVYLGFGSLTEACHIDTVREIIDVLAKKNFGAIVQANLPGLKDIALPPTIFPLIYAPHDWLFPRVKAVIHHGGVGTTAAGLYAGKPTLIMPFVWDQFNWGKMVEDLGVGPKYLSINKFNKEKFSYNLEKLVSDPLYQHNALKIMNKLNTEDNGIKKNVNRIFEILATLCILTLHLSLIAINDF